MLPHQELEEVTRAEANLLACAVRLVEQKASGGAIRAAYAELQELRARKEMLLRELGLLQWLGLPAEPRPSPKPGHRSGAGAATALLHLESDERHKMAGNPSGLH